MCGTSSAPMRALKASSQSSGISSGVSILTPIVTARSDAQFSVAYSRRIATIRAWKQAHLSLTRITGPRTSPRRLLRHSNFPRRVKYAAGAVIRMLLAEKIKTQEERYLTLAGSLGAGRRHRHGLAGSRRRLALVLKRLFHSFFYGLDD